MKQHKKINIAVYPKKYIHLPLLVAVLCLVGGGGLLSQHYSSADTAAGHMAWSSGAASTSTNDFAAYRGVPLDNTTTWPNRSNWDQISHPDIYGAVTAQKSVPLLTIGLAMLPDDGSGSFSACANGNYDAYYKTYGSELVRLNRGSAIVRLGWEANGDWYAWKIGNDVGNYVSCFRREARAIKSTAPSARIDWNMNKDSKMSVSVANAYPGDDVVDIIGVDFYDQWPAYADAASWSADYNSTQNGGPRGLGSWYNFARFHGKKLSLPEWGLQSDKGAGGGDDHPYFIQAMYDFFNAHAATIAYETYFNLQSPSFMIYPAGINPNASATYARLWKAGAVQAVTKPSPVPTPVTTKPVATTNSGPAPVTSASPKPSATTNGTSGAVKPVPATAPAGSAGVGSGVSAPTSITASDPATENHQPVVSDAKSSDAPKKSKPMALKSVAYVSAGSLLFAGLLIVVFVLRNIYIHRRVHADYHDSPPPTIVSPQS